MNNENGKCKVTDWKSFQKGCMRGTFTTCLPSGLVIRDIALFEKNASRWLAMPRQRYVNKQGEECFTTIVDFRDSKTAAAFRDLVLHALDEALARKEGAA